MSHIQDIFYQRQFGIFTHFLFKGDQNMTFAEENALWQQQTEALDPEYIAHTLHRIGAGYYFITLMQGSRFMLAPNAAYDRITGMKPGEACARRDVIAELIPALRKYGIALCLYYTGDGPHNDPVCGKQFGLFGEGARVTESFTAKWAEVLKEYALRYGDGIAAWWIDGCYDDHNGSRLGYKEEMLDLYYSAVKEGNPHALVAFNNGMHADKIVKWGKNEDFTSGEMLEFRFIPPSRFIDGAQAHMLIPLGEMRDPTNGHSRWCSRGAQISREALRQYVTDVHNAGGVLTVDVFMDAHGRFDEGQTALLTDLMR